MTPVMDDSRLVELARKGEVRAFEELMAHHEKWVYNLTLASARNHHDAEELTQTVFLKVWQNLPQFKGNSAFSTWLYSLTRNACIDWSRKNRNQTQSLSDAALVVLPSNTPDPEAEAIRRDRQARLWEAMDCLPEQARTILLLREMEGFDYQTIAVILNIPVGTVRSRLARARIALRDELTRKGGSPHEPL